LKHGLLRKTAYHLGGGDLDIPYMPRYSKASFLTVTEQFN
jgi:hypothetical protein